MIPYMILVWLLKSGDPGRQTIICLFCSHLFYILLKGFPKMSKHRYLKYHGLLPQLLATPLGHLWPTGIESGMGSLDASWKWSRLAKRVCHCGTTLLLSKFQAYRLRSGKLAQSTVYSSRIFVGSFWNNQCYLSKWS